MAPHRLIEASSVTRCFGNFTANDGIDLTVDAGEIVGLLGANGAGKSTLMRIVLGLLPPTSGTIRLLGRPPSRAIRRSVGYVPQGLGLYDDLTVAENLDFAARAYRTGSGRPIDADLRAESDTLVGALPLGLRRRLAFTTALAHKPSVLVLDEPTSGVDPLGRSQLWDAIHAAADAGAGVLVSTHYMEEADHCDRLVMLAAGRIVASGTLDDIIAGRRALQITAPRWDTAFQALDAAGIIATLRGRTLRVVDPDGRRVRDALHAAGVDALLDYVPSDFEEAFVALATQTALP
jgi:ABC-2 type transport system ATP-binding protein/ribosome-dependent ATPase